MIPMPCPSWLQLQSGEETKHWLLRKPLPTLLPSTVKNHLEMLNATLLRHYVEARKRGQIVDLSPNVLLQNHTWQRSITQAYRIPPGRSR